MSKINNDIQVTKYYRSTYQTPQGPVHDVFIGTSMEDARKEALSKARPDMILVDVLEFTNGTDAMTY